jgi:hypothetical protein
MISDPTTRVNGKTPDSPRRFRLARHTPEADSGPPGATDDPGEPLRGADALRNEEPTDFDLIIGDPDDTLAEPEAPAPTDDFFDEALAGLPPKPVDNDDHTYLWGKLATRAIYQHYDRQRASAGLAANETTGVRPTSLINGEPPPPPLVEPYMATTEATMIYGAGGSCKGTTAAHLALRYTSNDPDGIVYILDFEHHESEWGGRLRRLGATDAELDRIHYAGPYSKEWTAPTGALKDVAEYVRADCERLGVTLLIVDSYSAATTSGDAMGGKAAADEYFEALNRIGIRSLSLGHIPGTTESKWPPRPFGSVHIRNYCRETWAIAEIETPGGWNPGEYGLTNTTVELRCTKAQDRQKPPHQIISYDYEPDYGPITVHEEEKGAQSNTDLIVAALEQTPDVLLTAEQIAKTTKTMGGSLTAAHVYETIRKDRKGRFTTDRSKSPLRYKLS